MGRGSAAARGSLATALTIAEPAQAQALTAEVDAGAALAAAETALRKHRRPGKSLASDGLRCGGRLRVERARIEQGERHGLQGERRLERLQLEAEQLAADEFERELTELNAVEQDAAEALRCAL